jgi:hypothetical protein
MGLSGISGLSGLSAIFDSTAVVRLAAPGNLDADVTGGSADLSWDAVVGASSYEYRLNSGSWVANADETVTVTPGDGVYTFSVRAIDGDGVRGNSATSSSFTIDTVLPTVTGATIDVTGLILTITHSEIVNNHTGYALGSAGGRTISYVSGDGTTTKVFAPSSAITEDLSPVLNYTAGNVADAAGNLLATFADAAVVNGSEVAAPEAPETRVDAVAVHDMQTLNGSDIANLVAGSSEYDLVLDSGITVNSKGIVFPSTSKVAAGAGTAVITAGSTQYVVFQRIGGAEGGTFGNTTLLDSSLATVRTLDPVENPRLRTDTLTSRAVISRWNDAQPHFLCITTEAGRVTMRLDECWNWIKRIPRHTPLR